MGNRYKAPEKIETAKTVLRRILSDPLVDGGVDIQTIFYIGRYYGLVKSDMKEARRQIGANSTNVEGKQIWWLPRKEVW